MHKQVPRDTLLELIKRFPLGASLEEVTLGLTKPIPRRTVQRWLALLVSESKLIAVGKARARRYFLPENFGKERPQTPTLIPLSKESEKIQAQVTLPIQKRKPVGYNRDFLEKYIPNQTFYLPDQLRKKLLKIGGSGEGKYPAGTYARQIFHRLLIDLTWNSSRLEGNTYSLLETERLLSLGKAAEGKNLKETQMILNHKAAIEFLIHFAKEIGVNRYTILNLHTLLSDNLMPNPAASGRLRCYPVGIEGSVYMPLGIPQAIEECFDLLLEKAKKIEDPFEQAFFLMVQIPYLQVFDDVNKRTSRLAANIPLIQKNLCPLSFTDVPQETYINGLLGVYELNRIDLLRDVFEWAYERSCALYSMARQSMGEPDPFRLQYREEIVEIVQNIVLNCLDKTEAVSAARKWALKIVKESDRDRFIEVVEKELQSLHEGNIARYKLRPAEYENWKKNWQ